MRTSCRSCRSRVPRSIAPTIRPATSDIPPDGGGIGAGAAEIDLRYLASKRVLVLVDGRRWIKGSSGSGVSGAVDLNSIPVNAIQSIEILQDGASAIYGTDAIGGVLNVITSNDYESLKISGSAGSYDEGDGETAEFDVRFGGEGERGRALIDISYVDQKEVNTQDRETSVFPLPGYEGGVSSGIPPGRFRFCDTRTGCDPSDPESPRSNVVPNAGVSTPTWNPTDQANDDFHDLDLPDLFNYQPFNHLVTPNERVSVFGKAEYDITDDVTFRTLASFNNRKSQGRAAPVPLFFGPDGGGTPYMVNVFWPANHPFNPFGIDLIGNDPENNNLSIISRRPIEAGPRIFDQDVDTWYVSAGFDGEFELAEPAHVLGRHGNLVGEQRDADQAQSVQRPRIECRTGRSRRLCGDTGLRAARPRRRRVDDAGDARVRDLYGRRYELAGAGGLHGQPDRRPVRSSGRAAGICDRCRASRGTTARSFRIRSLQPARPLMSPPTRPRVDSTSTSITPKWSCRC